MHVVVLSSKATILPPAVCRTMSPPVLRIPSLSRQEVYLMHFTYNISTHTFLKIYIYIYIKSRSKYFLTDRYRSICTALFTHSLVRISFRKSA